MAGLRGLLARTASPLQTIPASCRRALAWDSTSGLLGGLFTGAVYPFLGVIARGELHASIYLIALLNSSGSVGNILNPMVAHAARSRPKLPFVVWPSAIGRACFLFMPLATAAPAFVAIACLANFTMAFAAPAYAAVIRDAYPAARRGRFMGLVRALVVIGTTAGAAVGGWLLDRHSYRFIFPAVTGFGLLSTLAFSRVGVPAAPEEGGTSGLRLADVFAVARRDPSFKLYCTCFYLYGFGNLISGPVMTVVQVDALHITKQWASYLAIAGALSSIAGYLYWGRIVDRRGPFHLMLMVIAVVIVSPITYFFAQSVPVLLIASCATGFGWAGGDLGYVNAAMRFGRRESATAYAAMFAFLQAMRGIPGPFIGAALSDLIGPRPVFLIALGFWAASAAVLLRSGALKINMEVE